MYIMTSSYMVKPAIQLTLKNSSVDGALEAITNIMATHNFWFVEASRSEVYSGGTALYQHGKWLDSYCRVSFMPEGDFLRVLLTLAGSNITASALREAMKEIRATLRTAHKLKDGGKFFSAYDLERDHPQHPDVFNR